MQRIDPQAGKTLPPVGNPCTGIGQQLGQVIPADFQALGQRAKEQGPFLAPVAEAEIFLRPPGTVEQRPGQVSGKNPVKLVDGFGHRCRGFP
ncbi:MAG: hypothetical protein A2Z86_04780 [Candidatus Glassbacteria bacterium GWA2_58_10]|uniref:Uncharacterized protein n=1 Tax=Candidatus Glassbacteria bacterium GWA2_58_10 TaxID=1817865 RepID=A0A1F5YEC5_9BACT|nr:MAG: hypothetical protein A2Z86_04780 [Candidatus Glassbacteria bacterium GWA2_58_10]